MGSGIRCKLGAGLGTEFGWSDEGSVKGKRLAERVFGMRGEPIKEGIFPFPPKTNPE